VRFRARCVALDGSPGPFTTITDVAGAEVGHHPVNVGDGPLSPAVGPVRTGVAAALPLGRDRVGRSVAAGWFSLSGNSEMTATACLDQVGRCRCPRRAPTPTP
jgi:D-aminopeptidase